MGYSAHAGSFNLDSTKTAGQTLAVTGVGFTPKVVFFFWGGSSATGDSVAGGNMQPGFGVMTGLTSRGMAGGSAVDAAASSTNRYFMISDQPIAINTAGTTSTDGKYDFSSFDADGFTLVVDDQISTDYRISYLALGGTDLTNVAVNAFALPTSTGNFNVTGVGFQPDAVVFMAAGSPTSLPGASTPQAMGFGFATSSSAQGTVSAYGTSGQATMVEKGYGYNGECFTIGQSGSTRVSFVSFGSDGFTLNRLEGTTANYVIAVSLKGGQYLVGDLTTRTDGNDISETVGFTPAGLLFLSANRALSTQDTVTAHNRASIGAATSTSNRACAAWSSEDAIADSETAYANYDSACYAFVKDDAIEALMDIKSIDSSGFTCVMDDTETNACWVTYLAIGPTTVAPTTISLSAAVAGTSGNALTLVKGTRTIALSKAATVSMGCVLTVIPDRIIALSQASTMALGGVFGVVVGAVAVDLSKASASISGLSFQIVPGTATLSLVNAELVILPRALVTPEKVTVLLLAAVLSLSAKSTQTQLWWFHKVIEDVVVVSSAYQAEVEVYTAHVSEVVVASQIEGKVVL
jgi:hypothetical protein